MAPFSPAARGGSRLPAGLLLLRIAPGQAGVGPDLDLARLRLRLLGQRDAQHAVTALSGNVPDLYRRRQREGAAETSVVPLDAVVALLLVGALELALPTQRQRVALDLDVDVVRVDFGQPDLQRDGRAVL